MGKQSKPPKIAFPNPIFTDLAKAAKWQIHNCFVYGGK